MTGSVASWPVRIGLTIILLTAAALPVRAATLSCVEAAAVAEAGAGIPTGLLLAIGVVESGRTDATGARAPWPWSIQSGGVGRYLASVEDAVAVVQALQGSGVQSIDIGCFQINLFHHPDAFLDLVSGFDPLTNALAATRFLVSLREEFGAWEPAVAAYHSRVETLGTPYRDRVLASWHSAPAPAVASHAVASIRIWGPAGEIGLTASLTPTLVAMAAPLPRMWIRMPRILTAAR